MSAHLSFLCLWAILLLLGGGGAAPSFDPEEAFGSRSYGYEEKGVPLNYQGVGPLFFPKSQSVRALTNGGNMRLGRFLTERGGSEVYYPLKGEEGEEQDEGVVEGSGRSRREFIPTKERRASKGLSKLEVELG